MSYFDDEKVEGKNLVLRAFEPHRYVDGDSNYVSIGAVLFNPNVGIAAVRVEVTTIVKDSNGNIIFSESETIPTINENSEFVFGAEYFVRGNPANVNIRWRIGEWFRVPRGNNLLNAVRLSHFNLERVGDWTDRYEFKCNAENRSNIDFYEVYISFIFLDKDNKILGGDFGHLWSLPPQSEDVLKLTNLVSGNGVNVRWSISYPIIEHRELIDIRIA